MSIFEPKRIYSMQERNKISALRLLIEGWTLLFSHSGCSLTKVLVGQREGDSVKLTCRTYHNSRWTAATDWMASEVKMEENSTIRITGVGGEQLLDEVAGRLKCR